MVTNHFGSVASATIRSMDIEKLPLIALVYRLRGTTEIFQVNDKFLALKSVPHLTVHIYLPLASRSFTVTLPWMS